MKVFNRWSMFVVALVLGAIQVAIANEPAKVDASVTIQQTTNQVMAVIDEASGYYENDPARFYQEIETVLDQVVDFNSFARGVMGPYGSKKMYITLPTRAEKDAFKARITRFSTIFKQGLVQTYAKGLLAFGGTKIEVDPIADNQKGKKSVTVVQRIYGDAEKPYTVLYKMRENRAGNWKLRNVTIEAINLGKVYQGQFAAAVKQYDGDIDKVIDSWSVTPVSEQGEVVASASE